MKICFDYYTKDATFATTAYQMAIEASARVSLNYDNDDDYHCINGEIDHQELEALFTYFEECGFVEHWSDL